MILYLFWALLLMAVCKCGDRKDVEEQEGRERERWRPTTKEQTEEERVKQCQCEFTKHFRGEEQLCLQRAIKFNFLLPALGGSRLMIVLIDQKRSYKYRSTCAFLLDHMVDS